MNVLIALSLTGLAALMAGFSNSKKAVYALAITGLVAAFGLNLLGWNTNATFFNNMLMVDNFAVAFTGVLLFATLLVFVLYTSSKSTNAVPPAETITLFIFSLAGGVMLVSYQHLLMLFLGIEILSIPLYILAGSKKSNTASNEAALKYFLMGAFMSAVLLFGIVLLYGATASFHLSEVSQYMLTNASNLPAIAIVGIILIMAGFAFKVAAAPFHFWAPDVYQGSPTLVTAFMATLVKTAAIAAFLRLVMVCFAPAIGDWWMVLAVVSVLSMTVGNIGAVAQTGFKRMMAYSGIAHAGYMLIAIIALNGNSVQTILYYTLTYSISTICAFTVLTIITQVTGSDAIESFTGLGKNNRLVAGVATVAMLSLAGIPPTAGFFGKYLVFLNAITAQHYWLAVIMLLNACVGIYYYFRIIPLMYFRNPEKSIIPVSLAQKVALLVTALLAIVLGVLPSLVIDLV